MFTIDQIKEAHSKVKSGADFPAYIREMKQIGVLSYEHFVIDGHTEYYGGNDFALAGDAKWPPLVIAGQGSTIQLQRALAVHQAGQTTYPDFCRDAAGAGVEVWIVDTAKMTCTYFDAAGNELLTEHIPDAV